MIYCVNKLSLLKGICTLIYSVQTTKRQVQMFKEKISKLQKKFKEQGPGAEGTVLEAGAEAVKRFTETLAKYAYFFILILSLILFGYFICVAWYGSCNLCSF
jgi:hypothetical protein